MTDATFYWWRKDRSVFSFTCVLSAKMYVLFKNKIRCAQLYLFSIAFVNINDLRPEQNDGSGIQKRY